MNQRSDILVVDDEPVITAAAQKILSAEGLTVDQAADARSAAGQIETQHYALVLCDLMLPGISGLAMIEHVRRHLPDTPVVLITGYATLPNAVEAFRRGAFDFVPKPFDVGELVGVVRRGLSFAGADSRLRARIDLSAVAGKWEHAGALYALGGHGWAVPERDGSARLGFGETFASLADEIEEVELTRQGGETLQGNRCVRILTRQQTVHKLWAPLSGRVVETNERAFDAAGIAGWDALCRQWVMRIVPSNLEDELTNLTRR